MPSFGDFLLGTKSKIKQVATGTPQMEQFQNSILQQLQQMMQPGGGYQQAQQYNQNLLQGGPQAFQQFSQPYMQQFNEQVLPGIAERFAGAGALSSSGFGQALGGAASGLQGQLAQLFSQLQQNAASQQYGQFNQLGNFGLNYKPFENITQEGSGGALAPILAGLAKGGIGALTGGASLFGDLFNPLSGGF